MSTIITLITNQVWYLYSTYSYSAEDFLSDSWLSKPRRKAIRLFFDVSLTQKQQQLHWSNWFPNMPSSFSNSVLSEGKVVWKNHTWNDLIQFKWDGTLVALPNDEIATPCGGYNSLSHDSNFLPFVIPNRGAGGIGFRARDKRSDLDRQVCRYWCYWNQGPFHVVCQIAYYRKNGKVGFGYYNEPGESYVLYSPPCEVVVDIPNTLRFGFVQENIPAFRITAADDQNSLSKKVTRQLEQIYLLWLSRYSNPSMTRIRADQARYKGTTLADIVQPPFSYSEVLFPVKERNPNWSEMAARAYQDLGMADINGIANIKELTEMGSAVTGFLKTVKSLPSKKVKAAAQAFLAVHYGFKLTILDAKELSETLEDYAYRRSSLSKAQAVVSEDVGDSTYTWTYQVFFDVFAQLRSTLLQCVALADGFVTMENAWDMTPWSFVIDWFVDFGSVLQSLDNWYNLMQRHDVVAVGKSLKCSQMVQPSHLSPMLGGCLQATYYAREYDKELVFPSIIPSVTINPFNHLVEATALFISLK